MAKQPISAQQEMILTYIERHIKDNKLCPTLQDIADALRLKGRQAARYHVLILEKKGWLKRSKYVRNIHIK